MVASSIARICLGPPVLVVGNRVVVPCLACVLQLCWTASRLPSMKSLPPPPWTWISTKPGLIQPPLASMVSALLGMRFFDCPTYVILPSRHITIASSTVRSGKIAVPPVKQRLVNVLFLWVGKATPCKIYNRKRQRLVFALNHKNKLEFLGSSRLHRTLFCPTGMETCKWQPRGLNNESPRGLT